MLTHYHAVRDAARIIAGAIDRSVEALNEGRVEHEPAMTDRMLGMIEESLHGAEIRGIRWHAKTLTDRASGAQEKTYGADFMGVLNIKLPDYTVSKGFLAQAKLVRRNKVDDLRELKSQCEKMLNFSPASFVFLYSDQGVRVVPAISVVGSNIDPSNLYDRSAQRFFEEHFQCFIGDQEISSPTPNALDGLRLKFEARSALLLMGTADEMMEDAPVQETR